MMSLYIIEPFHDGGRYHTELNKSMDWFLYDIGLRLILFEPKSEKRMQ